MIMADVLKWFLLILGVLLVFISYWVVAEALFPSFVTRARSRYTRPVKLTFVGLLTMAPAVAIGIVLLNGANPAVKVVGWLIVGVPIILGLVGSAGFAQKVGLGLPSPTDAAQPWRRVLRGGTLLSLTFLLPFVGWFLILPWTLISGFGAAITSFRPAAAPASSNPPSAQSLPGETASAT